MKYMTDSCQHGLNVTLTFIWPAGPKISGEKILRCQTYFSAVSTVTAPCSSFSFGHQHQPADDLLSDIHVIFAMKRMQTPVAVATVIPVKEFCHRHAYFSVLIVPAQLCFVAVSPELDAQSWRRNRGRQYCPVTCK